MVAHPRSAASRTFPLSLEQATEIEFGSIDAVNAPSFNHAVGTNDNMRSQQWVVQGSDIVVV